MIRHHTVVETEEFSADIRHLKVPDEDVTRIITEISLNPESGDIIAGSGGLRKVRIAGRGGGKSGGYRILVLYLNEYCPTYIFAMLSKGERANFSKAELAELSKIANEIKRYWKERKQ
ncbi:type II toxin-antitoxin system RelE/ParE family toxin [Hyphococcus sp.]|uniref:type II toxin-antitoxin system RelE/ParE family toxin n=1 Tax=Hyphococcus sp. TaxID=2038636 RepID=UPI003CCBA762